MKVNEKENALILSLCVLSVVLLYGAFFGSHVVAAEGAPCLATEYSQY